MKFTITAISKCSGRLGVLSSNNKERSAKLCTPLLLLYTKAGIVPHLSKEVLDYFTIDQHGTMISVATTYNMEPALAMIKTGISTFVGLDKFPVFITLNDVAEPINHGSREKGCVPIYTKSGKINMTAEKYMDIIEYSLPDIYSPMCDSDTSIQSSKKRLLKSVERTNEFFEICLNRHRMSSNLKNSMFVAPVVGGYDIFHREASIKNLLLKNEFCGGFIIDGLHNGGIDAAHIDLEQLKEIVKFSLNLLPREKLIILVGAYNPVTILEMIKIGVDVFDSSYPYLMSKKNCVLTFNFDLQCESKTDFYIDLADKKYSEQFSSFVDGCACFSCQKHTRSYTHHLITRNELVAPILINLHNLHHYNEFFKTIRDTIASNKINELIKLISKQYNSRDPS